MVLATSSDDHTDRFVWKPELDKAWGSAGSVKSALTEPRVPTTFLSSLRLPNFGLGLRED